MRTRFLALPLFGVLVLALAGCDAAQTLNGPSNAHTAAPSLVLPVVAPASDVFFSTLSVRPGGVVRSMLERSDALDAPRLALTSTHVEERDEHRVGLDVSGVAVEEVELFIKRLEDSAFVSVQKAKQASEIEETYVDRAPQSSHYVEETDPDGDGTIWILVHDYQETGANFRSSEGDDTAVDHVGYRVRLKETEAGFTQLRIDGYDEAAVASMRTLSAPEVRARARHFFKAAE